MNKQLIRRCLPVFLVFIFASPASHAATSLWVAESGGAIKIASETGDILFEIPDAGGIDAIAVDNDSGRVWTYGRHKHQQRLRAYDAEGDLQVDVQAQIHHDTTPLDMLADADGVWLAAHRDVYRFDSRGQLQKHIRFRHPVSGMTLDTERSHLWVAVVSGHVFILDRNGDDVDRFWTYFPLIAQLDYDESLDGVWLVVGPYLLRLNAETRDVQFVSRFGVGFKLWRHLSADGQGGVWGADPVTLSHVNAAGEIEFTFKPFQGYHGKKTLQDLVADREDGSVWLASRTTLKQYSLVGAQQKELTPDLGDGVIRSISRLALAASTRPPELSIVFPTANSFINTNTPTLALRYGSEGTVDTGSIQITHDSNTLSANCSATQTEASCALNTALPEGDVMLEVAVADTGGNVSEPAQVTFTVDTVAPAVTVTNPADGLITNQPQLTVNGNVSETPATLTLTHNGDSISLQADSNNAFSQSITLSEGSSAITVSAVDRAGNTGDTALTVILDTVVPVMPDLGLISISRPGEDGTVLINGRAGSVEPNSKVTITNTRTGESISVMADADGAFSASLVGQTGDDIRITVGDTAGNVSEPAQAPVTSLPPDPALVVPPLNPTQTTPLLDAIAFLYTGNHPIQTGVQPGTIEARRVAVIRGRVLDKQNNPLPGVTVSVKDHPGFGQTLSRADGRFDLAVNGGGVLTLDYQKESYLPVQRKVDVPWQDYIVADDIVMIQLDPRVTTIELTRPVMQVARGTPQTDEDGTRQATLLFPAGATATMTLPDGTVQNLTTLNVRATEYTVGDNGPEAMPGELPPTSAYTYAVELSVDEALTANAKRVDFSQPVPFYVDNFLDFPTGEAVPVGYYDTGKATWIPYENGRIVEVLSIDNGRAVLDVTGSGTPATQAQLDALSITEVELQQLANLYTPGKSLWRVALKHFSTWDCNWPYGPPEDAVPPPPPEETPKPDVECDQPGCTIGAQTQTLGETIPIAGTPFSLNYRSDRAPGRKDKSIVTVAVSGDSVPASLQAIWLSIRIAGQHHVRGFGPSPNQRYTFEWDGYDGYGRPVYGGATADIILSYAYACVYRPGDNGFGRFGRVGQAIGTRNNCRSMRLMRRWQVPLESPLHAPVNVIGNWSLDIHHAWEAGQDRLVLGDGKYRYLHPVIQTVAGNGLAGSNDAGSGGFGAGDGGPATEARVGSPSGVVLDAAGNLYILQGTGTRIRRVRPNGDIQTFAGGGNNTEPDWTGPATQARFNTARAIAVDAHGNLYIAQTNNHRIRKVSPNGVITTVAGSGATGPNGGAFAGDGGPATQARLNHPTGVAVDKEGNIYIADTNNHRIRKVGPDGIIRTIAGGGNGGHNDGIPAANAWVQSPWGLAVDTAGNLYIASGDYRVRKISPDGIITTVAGVYNTPGFSGDGGPATEARLRLNGSSIAVDTAGNLYIADTGNNRIRKVGPDGIITTVAGGPAIGVFGGDGGPPAEALLSSPRDVTVDTAGNLYIADTSNHRVRRISTPVSVVDPRVAVEDGRQQFVFDVNGRHLRTLNTLTGATEYEFGRDDDGKLITITDIDGDVTTIERDTSGEAVALVSTDGQRTELTVDANGHLTAVTNPANETYRMEYTPDGLMTRFIDRRQLATRFEYDDLGRLTADINAGLGGWTLERAESGSGYQVTMTTAEGRELNYAVSRQLNGDRLQTNIAADGALQTLRFKSSGQETATQPDGTQITLQTGPDPRFGMQSPIAQSLTARTPSGLTSTAAVSRMVSLSNPADPLSLQSLTETTTVNGNAYRSVYQASTKTFTFTSPEGRTGTRTINDKGRPVRTQMTGLAPVDFGYDARGRLEQILADDGVEQRLTRLSYYGSGPQAGFLQSITDAEDRTVRFEYDNVGRVTKQILPDSREISYGYDANGNVTRITPPGRPAHVFNYNTLDLEDEYTPPDVEGIANPATVYDYNLDKELIRITRPDGQEVNFSYNSKAQLESMTIPRGTYTYGYHPTTGQLNNITAPDGGTLIYNYDGFLLRGQTWTGDVSGSVTQNYNNHFLISQRCVNSNCISFGYDNDNMLTSAGSLSITRDLQRAGLITNMALGNVSTAKGYNSFGELSTVDTDVNSADIYGVTYVRDNLGRITQKTEVIEGASVTEIYGYDIVGRLEMVTRNGTLTTYVYDANGNRLSKTTGTGVESGSYDDQDRLLTYNGCSYSYTENGELESKICGSEVTKYNYDVIGNLFSVALPDDTEIEYIIDGRNRRVGKNINGTLVQGFLYADQLNPIAELEADGSIKSRFVYGTKINVPDYMIKDSVTYRIVSDHLGSPRLVINATDGTVVQRMDYDEFGNVINDTNPGFQPFGFAGGLYDPGIGLVRFGARDYLAEVGRWTTKDPIEFRGNSVNLYGYTFNDPINFTDSLGLQGEENINDIVREKFDFSSEVLGNEMIGNDGETQYHEMPICVVCSDGSLPEIPNVDNYYNTGDYTNSDGKSIEESKKEFLDYWNWDFELIREQYCY